MNGHTMGPSDVDAFLQQTGALEDEDCWFDEDDDALYPDFSEDHIPEPEYPREPAPRGPAIRAYNADFSRPNGQRERQSKPARPVRPAEPHREPEPVREKPSKKRHGCLTRLVIFVLVMLAAVLLVRALFIHPPKTDAPIGSRKWNTASILLCGTDVSGDRTDTMMLLHISGRQVHLLTLPRDTLTHATSGKNAKLNSAYGRNGGGVEGAEAMLDYVQDIIGYRPDAYLVVDLNVVGDIIALMGGVDFDVPKDMQFSDKSMDLHVDLKAGLQHLNAEQALGLLRFRYGYVNQDIGRQDVQKDFLKACAKQWLRADNLDNLKQTLNIFSQRSIGTLDRANYLWIAWHILLSGGKIQTDTLPGTPDYIGGASYYVLDKAAVAEMIDKDYNPYRQTISADDLTIIEG